MSGAQGGAVSSAGRYHDDDDDSSSSSSSSSDDEYLTLSSGKAGEDREAVIRRKLLESFYGASAAAASSGDAAGVQESFDSDASTSYSPSHQQKSEYRSDLTVSHEAGAEDELLSPTHNTGSARRGTATGTSRTGDGNSSSRRRVAVPSTDLDSSSFDAQHHTVSLVRSSDTTHLLSTDESLALEIRTLDSTMQTLVYENYSKFIDATDAIRSIGVSVHAKEEGLKRLREGIVEIQDITTDMDGALRASRELVADRLRVRRLLSRLDALLKLPDTLRAQIQAKKYRLAAKSHASATQILGRHSAGFESLRSIEVECHGIVKDMVADLRQKLLHWSGQADRDRRTTLSTTPRRSPLDQDDDDNNKTHDDDAAAMDDEDEFDFDNYEAFDGRGHGPSPPQSIAEIFECSGTLLQFKISKQPDEINFVRDEINADDTVLEQEVGATSATVSLSELSSGLTDDECKTLSLEACTRFLERQLDEHRFELRHGKDIPDEGTLGSPSSQQRSITKTKIMEEINVMDGDEDNDDPQFTDNDRAVQLLIPTHALDGILEAATLFGISFPSDRPTENPDDGSTEATVIGNKDHDILSDFVSESFTSFLTHVRMTLLDRTLMDAPNEDDEDVVYEGTASSAQGGGGGDASLDGGNIDDDEEGEVAYAEISAALAHLLRSVRELASGLALPEVGLDMEVASGLVDQTVEITESMVRRRVARKFYALRARVVLECLAPFIDSAIVDTTTEEDTTGTSSDDAPLPSRVVQIVQMSSVAVSDSMQLVDDRVRSILSGGAMLETSPGSVDSTMVKVAIQKHAKQFAFWLATTLELVAGCDPSDRKLVLEVKEEAKESDEEGSYESGIDSGKEEISPSSAIPDEAMSVISEDRGDFEDEDEADSALHALMKKLQDVESDTVLSDIVLAMAEMCRLAERSVGDNINQSIMACTDEDPKAGAMASGLFQSTAAPSKHSNMNKEGFDADKAVSNRFKVAASRILTLYTMNRGFHAAHVGCEQLFETARSQGDTFPDSPRPAAWHVLQVAKETSLDCATVFGGDKIAAPTRNYSEDEEEDDGDMLTHRAVTSSGVGHMAAAMKGLQLDVERMFADKVQVYPHTSTLLEFSRNAVVSSMLKIAFKAIMEHARICTFTAYGYRQLQVDVEFLRQLVPHYVKEEDDGGYTCASLYTLLTDIMLSAGERCVEVDCVGMDEFYDPVNGIMLNPRSIVWAFMQADTAEGGQNVSSQFTIF